jgi:exosortase/archaeosortase family protein
MLQRLLKQYLPDTKMVRPVEFAIKMVFVYAGWRTFKYFSETQPDFLWGSWDWFKELIGVDLIRWTALILSSMGYPLVHHGRLIVVDGYSGIYASDLCLGIPPLVIFTGFILSFGNNHKARLWFIPLGLIVIYITNILRMVALVLVQVHQGAYFRLAHDYVYLILTYGFIFIMVMWWMNSLAFKPEEKTAP